MIPTNESVRWEGGLAAHPKGTAVMTRSIRTVWLLILTSWLVLAACTGTADPTPPPEPIGSPESPSPTVIIGATTEAAESEQVNDQDAFLRVIAPLDEARGYCLDIPGHMAGVRIESPLQVHTCKHGIWNQDGRFDLTAAASGVIRMPHYQLCLQAEDSSIGARLHLAECREAGLQTWTLKDSGQIALEVDPQICITVEEGPGRDAGGPRYLMKGVGLDTCAQGASDRQQWTDGDTSITLWSEP